MVYFEKKYCRKHHGLIQQRLIKETGDMKIVAKEISAHEKCDFDDFVLKSENSHVMQTSSWKDVIESEKYAKSSLIAFYCNDNICATAVLNFKPIYKYFNGMICEGGPILADYKSRDIWHGVIQCLTSFAKSRRSLFVRAWPYIPYEGNEFVGEAFQLHGYAQGGNSRPYRGTNLIDLCLSSETLMNMMHPSARRDVRQCLRKEAVVRHGNDSQLLSSFWSVFSQTCKTKGLKTPDYNTLATMLRLNLASIHISEYKGEVLNGILLIHHPNIKTVTLLYAGTARSTQSIPAGHFLHWHAMIWAQESGFKTYDLGGIGLDEPSEAVERINVFKRRLGGIDIKIQNQYERFFYAPGLIKIARNVIIKRRNIRTVHTDKSN